MIVICQFIILTIVDELREYGLKKSDWNGICDVTRTTAKDLICWLSANLPGLPAFDGVSIN
jgi:hypothetical protein